MKTRAKKTSKRRTRVIEGSGNAFADLDLPKPRARVAQGAANPQIYTILKGSGLTQVEMAKILGVQQPQVSLLMRNRAGNFSLGSLMEFLTALRQDIEKSPHARNMAHSQLSRHELVVAAS